MVEDKINYRDTGPKSARTHRSLHKDDPMKVECASEKWNKNSLLTHGMSKFVEESFMKRSDEHEFLFDREQGRLDTSRDMILYAVCDGLVYTRT
jgi:hypothetical protein